MVEKWIPQTKRRVDLFGFIDIVAVVPGSHLLGIQATSNDNVASRITKIREDCQAAARDWLEAGGRIAVYGWAKKGGRGQRKLWTLRVEHVHLDDLPASRSPHPSETDDTEAGLFRDPS